MKGHLQTITQETLHNEGISAASSVFDQMFFSVYKTVLCFLSMQHEIDTGPLLNTLFCAGKHIFIPKLLEKQLCFIQIYNIKGPWNISTYGTLEPASCSGLLCENDFPVLIFMPGLAFDLSGNRLGRGKGYYDKFCKELDALNLEYRAVGLCLSTQIVPYVPSEVHDKAVDGIFAGALGFLQTTEP